MTRTSQIAYGLLLTAWILLLSLLLALGLSYARYDNAVGWNTVVNSPQDPAVSGPQLPILTTETRSLEFAIPENITDPQWRLEKLGADQSFTEYTQNDLVTSLTENTILVELGETLPAAGTYRLVITWETEEPEETEQPEGNEETEITEGTGETGEPAEENSVTVTFFINYSDV